MITVAGYHNLHKDQELDPDDPVIAKRLPESNMARFPDLRNQLKRETTPPTRNDSTKETDWKDPDVEEWGGMPLVYNYDTNTPLPDYNKLRDKDLDVMWGPENRKRLRELTLWKKEGETEDSVAIKNSPEFEPWKSEMTRRNKVLPLNELAFSSERGKGLSKLYNHDSNLGLRGTVLNVLVTQVSTPRKPQAPRLETVYVFSWYKIPGKDNEMLIGYLIQNFGIKWAKTAKIEKIDNGKTIKVYTDRKSLLLKLNDEKTEVILEIDDGRTDKFTATINNEELNIYKTIKEQFREQKERSREYMEHLRRKAHVKKAYQDLIRGKEVDRALLSPGDPAKATPPTIAHAEPWHLQLIDFRKKIAKLTGIGTREVDRILSELLREFVIEEIHRAQYVPSETDLWWERMPLVRDPHDDLFWTKPPNLSSSRPVPYRFKNDEDRRRKHTGALGRSG